MKTQLERDGVQPPSARQMAGRTFGQDKAIWKARLAEGQELPFFGPLLFRFCGLAGLDSKGFLDRLVTLEDEIGSQPGFRITLAEAVPSGGKRAYTLGSIRAILIQLIADKRVA